MFYLIFCKRVCRRKFSFDQFILFFLNLMIARFHLMVDWKIGKIYLTNYIDVEDRSI